MNRGGRLPAQSARKRAKRALRAACCAEVERRAGGRCQAIAVVPDVTCGGGHTAHETIQRSLWPDGDLDPDNCVWLCHTHHMWVHDNVTRSHELGLLRHSWER